MAKLLNHTHPGLNISTAKFLVKPQQLTRLQRLLSTYQPRDIANVLGWRCLIQLIPHMNHQIRQTKLEYDKKRHLVEDEMPRY